MKKIRIGLVRVITLEESDLLNVHARILSDYYPNIEAVSFCIPDQPKGIYDEATERTAVPKIIALADILQNKGVDAVFISCAADPAVAECRKKLDIPVIGAGSAAAGMAAAISDSIGILRITDRVPTVISNILGEKIIGDIKPCGVSNTLDLLGYEGRSSAMEAAGLLKEKGCDAILLACTGMSTAGIAKGIKENLHLRVIDPIEAAAFYINCVCCQSMSK